MSKDMRDRLNWMADELMDEEPRQEADLDLQFELDDILGEFLQEEEPVQTPARNRAVDFNRMAFGDEELDESAAVRVTRKTQKQKKEAPRKKGIGGLVVVAILEIIAIIAVLLRWALWFL